MFIESIYMSFVWLLDNIGLNADKHYMALVCIFLGKLLPNILD